IIAGNAAAVRESYSIAGCGRRLQAVYESVLDSPRGGPVTAEVDGRLILDDFLPPSRFHSIRCEE
ncbi:MAG: hypothetical protein ACE5KM_13185, partial [Planctomycetaceae bacterium]